MESVGQCWAEGKLVKAVPILGPPGGDITIPPYQQGLTGTFVINNEHGFPRQALSECFLAAYPR